MKLRDRASATRRPAGHERVVRRFERELSWKLSRREPEAMRIIQDTYGSTLLGYLEQALHDRASAEEVLQQVLLEVWQRGDRYDPARGSPLSWLMSIARSRAIDQLRKRRPEPLDPGEATELIDRRSAFDEIDALAERWRVAHILTELPEQEANLLRMRFALGMTQTMIAQQTGIPLGTVKMRMASALQRLRGLLDEDED